MMATPLLFNPSQATTDELESTFVGRHGLLNQLERDLLDDRESGTPRHWQIIGPRGSGKSHLTELLSRRMRTRHAWRIARLPEENYQVATLGELLEQIALRSSDEPSHSPLTSTRDDERLQEQAVDLLRIRLAISGKPLLVVLENLSSLFQRQLRSPRDQARLRDLLTNNPPFILIGTSTSQSQALTKHSAPFFEFFQTVTLDDLDRAEITELIRARADWERNASLLADFERVKDRIDAIYHLSGGNPRLALALYRAIENGVTTELHSQIMKLLDEVTPYYQARLNDIPPQAVRVLTEMAISERVATPAMIGRRSRIPTNQVTAQIQKLLDERLIVQGGKPDARSRYYEFKDRLLRIWIQMRESSGAARRLRFLAEFFERWYAGRAEDLEEASRRTLSGFWAGLDDGDTGRCEDHLKTLSYLAEIRPGFDRSVVLQVMAKHVNESPESDIRAHVEALKKSFETSTDLKEMEAVAYLLSECYISLNSESDGKKYLQAALTEGSQSEAIAGRLMSALLCDKQYDAALSFGNDWVNAHPSHLGVAEDTAIAVCGTGDFGTGLDLLEQEFRRGFHCSTCTEKALRRGITALRDARAPQEVEREFAVRVVELESAPDPDVLAVQAVLDVLAGSRLAEIPSSTILTAATAWKRLADAPSWFIGKAICAISHRRRYESHSLAFIEALTEKFPVPLGQHAVDHLVEIVPRLRHKRKNSTNAAYAYARAVSLIRHHTTPERVTAAFRSFAPIVAQRYPDLTSDVIALYQEWLAEGHLSEPLTPYSEAIMVLDSHERSKALESLHAETREAVSLLLAYTNAKPSV